MLLVELYGKDKKGGYKVWAIGTTESGDLTIAHGKEGGKMSVKMEKIAPKNVGRSNETTPEQQADLEAQGRIKKQIDKGYRHSKEELDELPLLAMLAGDYTKIGHRIDYTQGVDYSDKLDGVRCVAKCWPDGTVSLESRTGQLWDVPHIKAELELFMKPGDVLDGELYIHGEALQDITSAVKRTDPEVKVAAARAKLERAVGDDKIEAAYEELAEALFIESIRPKIQFIVFDMPSDSIWSVRIMELQDYARDNFLAHGFVRLIKYDDVWSEEEMKRKHADCVARGFEGIMLRNAQGMYESGKRSADLQKYKTFIDAEFLILDIIEDKQGFAVFILQNDLTAETFQCVMGDMEQRKHFIENKELYIGKYMTVQFQARYKKTLLPQFPTGKAIREGVVIQGEFIPAE